MNVLTGYEQFDRILEEYKEVLKLTPTINFDASSLLNLTRDQIEAMDEGEALNTAAELTQYSIYIQQQENRERARVSWCENQIQIVAGEKWDDFDKYLPKEIKISKISHENPAIAALAEIKVNALARSQELFGLAQLIKYYATIFFEKGKKNGWNRRDSQFTL